jgi:hypothetical protein
LSQLLLLLGHNRQQGHKGMLDEGRRGRPFVERDTVWWRRAIQAASMPRVGTVVK